MPAPPPQPDVVPDGGAAPVWGIVTRTGLLDRLRAIARRKKRDWPAASWTADSVTDDTLIRMTSQRHLPDEPEAFIAAFTEQLKRTIVEKYRRKNAKKRGGGCIRRAFAHLLGAAGPAGGADPDLAGLVDEYVRTRPLHAVIAWMTAELGLTEDEIAPMLGIEPASVRKKLRRAVAELRSELEPDDNRRRRPD